MRLPGSVTNRWLIVAAVVQCACLALPMVPVLRRHRWGGGLGVEGAFGHGVHSLQMRIVFATVLPSSALEAD